MSIKSWVCRLAGLGISVMIITGEATQASLIEPVSTRVLATAERESDEDTAGNQFGPLSASATSTFFDDFHEVDITVSSQVDVTVGENQIRIVGETNTGGEGPILTEGMFEAEVIFDVTAAGLASLDWVFGGDHNASGSLSDGLGNVVVFAGFTDPTPSAMIDPLPAGRYTLFFEGEVDRTVGFDIGASVDVTFTIIPEPGCAMVIATVATGWLMRRQRIA